MDNRQFEDFDDRMMREACTGCAGAIVFWIVLIILMLCFASCKTRTIVVETVRTDTTYISKHQRDSIFQHDSIFLHELQKGDTVFVLHERWHTKYVDRAVHDTAYIATHDTIPQPYPVPEYIERKLTWWQKTKMNLGLILLGIIAALGIIGVYKLYRMFRP